MTKKLSECPYCKRPADEHGGINHVGGCTGLQDVPMNRLQYDIRQAEIERLREFIAMKCIGSGVIADSERWRMIHEWNKAKAAMSGERPTVHEPKVGAPFPYPTDRDGWICSGCHGWNGPKTRVCLHSHVPLDPQGASRDASSGEK